MKDNYRIMLKSFGSRNQKVLVTVFKIIKELGDIEDRSAEWIET